MHAFIANQSAKDQDSTLGILTETSPVAAFKISSSFAITVQKDRVHPWSIQCLLVAIERLGLGICTDIPNTPISPTIIDSNGELTVWASEEHPDVAVIAELWHEIAFKGQPTEIEAITTPKLYGSKQRLTDFLYGVAVACLPAGLPILDLMAGTGIVSRKLAARHPMAANDANPYACLLTRAQTVALDLQDVSSLHQLLLSAASENLNALRKNLAGALEEEQAYFHADYDEATLAGYIDFCSRPVMEIENHPPRPGSPHSLCVSRFANAYFGILQAAELDSLRAAIEITIPTSGPERDIALAALLITACALNSGPHFAQPRKLTSLAALRDVVERRARSVLWEFELTLERLSSRKLPGMPINPVEKIVSAMAERYSMVRIFSEEIRHHSQGVRLSAPRGRVTEHVIVGSNS